MTTRRRRQTIIALGDKAYRDAYVSEHVRQGIAFQIRALRDSLGWTQAKLGELTGKPQPTISQLEDPNYGRYTLKTLKSLASAFDVALIVRFVPFSHLVHYTTNISQADLAPTSFNRDSGLRLSEFPELVTTTAPMPAKSSTHVETVNSLIETSQLPLPLGESSIVPINGYRANTDTTPQSLRVDESKAIGAYR